MYEGELTGTHKFCENINDCQSFSPCVKTLLPNEKITTEILHENNGYEKSYENEVNENCSITSKTGTTRTPTSRPQSTTTFHGSSPERIHISIHDHIHWRTLLDSLLPFLLPFPPICHHLLFHLELFPELLYTKDMTNLRCSATNESEDTLNAFISPTPCTLVGSCEDALQSYWCSCNAGFETVV